MEVIKLGTDLLAGFLAFCVANREKVDGSFLTDEDLSGFEVGPQNPTCLLPSGEGAVVGAASLMVTPRALASKKARFRIFWCPVGSGHDYALLLGTLLKDVSGIDSAYLFAPLDDGNFGRILDALGFVTERNVYSLIRSTTVPSGEPMLPKGFSIRPFVGGMDETAWCAVRNAAFSQVKGNEAPQSAEDVLRMASSPDMIEGAMLVLEEQGRAVAVARGSADEINGRPAMNIGPIAVLPDRQGMGLGRALLRSLVLIASARGYDAATLSVNADNENALRLYVSEGFTKLRSFACRAVKPSSLL